MLQMSSYLCRFNGQVDLCSTWNDGRWLILEINNIQVQSNFHIWQLYCIIWFECDLFLWLVLIFFIDDEFERVRCLIFIFVSNSWEWLCELLLKPKKYNSRSLSSTHLIKLISYLHETMLSTLLMPQLWKLFHTFTICVSQNIYLTSRVDELSVSSHRPQPSRNLIHN